MFPWVTVVPANLQNARKAKHYKKTANRENVNCSMSAYTMWVM